jgi:hypothetical protein
MLNGTVALENEEQPQGSLKEQLQKLSGFLVHQELDPSHLEGMGLGFALELAALHGLYAAKGYVERNHTAAVLRM